MEEIRRLHNDEKRNLIASIAREGDSVLDVGCGFGGDLQKWRHARVNLSMCEPDAEALEEAKNRAKNLKIRVNFYHGDIFACPHRKYDIICYNFSLHYIFQTREIFTNTLHEIRKRLKPGGKLIGIIPDSEQIIFRTPLNDTTTGNFFKLSGTSNGDFGEKLYVHLVDTPYYADGPRPEPLAHRDLLVTHLENMGFSMEHWEGLSGNPISRLYSKFIFVYKNDSSDRVSHH
jgi:SAM-dependent methyltransferase|tara:strand:- start:3314 stop:4006 length:693 start_codon:yes stop_codon:yes gene_type:complete